MPAKLPNVQWEQQLVRRDKGGKILGGTIVNALGRPVGLEIELATWGTLLQLWRPQKFTYERHFDRSVTPSQHEMVTCPLAGDKFVAAAFELGEALYTHNATVNDSCGLHVHVAADDLSYWDMRRLLKIYAAYEAEIYQLLAPKRLASDWCNRYYHKLRASTRTAIKALDKLKSTGEIKAAVIDMVYGIDGLPKKPDGRDPDKQHRRVEFATERTAKYGRNEHGIAARYAGVNIHSWFHRGTVEWRMFEGTTNIEDLLCWPMFCAWIVELSTRLSDAQISRLPAFTDFVQTWLPPFVVEWVKGKQALNNKQKEVA